MEEEVLDKAHGMFLFLLVNRDGNMYFVYLNQGYKWKLLEIGGKRQKENVYVAENVAKSSRTILTF